MRRLFTLLLIFSMTAGLTQLVTPANAVTGTLIGYGDSVPTPPHGGGGGGPFDYNCTSGWAVISVSIQSAAGSYSTGFKFSCAPLSNDLTISTTTTENIVGLAIDAGAGETWVSVNCPNSLVAYGFRGNEGWDGNVAEPDDSFFLNDLGLNCFDPYTTGGGTIGALANGYNRNIITSNCASSGLITGFSLRQGAGIDRVTPICRDFSSARAEIRNRKQAEADARERQRKEKELQDILISVLALGAVSSAVSDLSQLAIQAPKCAKGKKIKLAKQGKCPAGWTLKKTR